MNTHYNYSKLDECLLGHSFDEVTAYEFYRDIFGDGELEEQGVYEDGKYNALALEFVEIPIQNDKGEDDTKIVGRCSIVTDDLDKIAELQHSPNFCIIAPISYCGKSRASKNARFMYALCIEVDGLRKTKDNAFAGLDDLIHQCSTNFLPKPTYIVSSGTGVHLYYVFEKPIPLFPNVAKSIERYKRVITQRMWNRFVTTLHDEKDIQYESIFQGFRMVGTLTKYGLAHVDRTQPRIHQNSGNDIVRAYKFDDGEKVSIEYMNSFVKPEQEIVLIYKSNLTLAKAKELYPEWYEQRIVQGNKEKGAWECHRGLYDWWKNKILSDGKVGHRYYCLMLLSIYAIKCGNNITYEELEADCFEIMKYFDTLTIDPSNPFTVKDVSDALQAYHDKGFVTYPINSISHRSGIHIEKNKRNGLKQKDHLEEARAIRDIRSRRRGKENWYDGGGRPVGSGTKHRQIQEWRVMNPDGKKADCIRELGLTKPTVYKWWDVPHEEVEKEVEELQGIIQSLEPDWSELLKDLYEE